MSLTAILIAALVALAGAGGAYWQGRQDGRSAELAEAARDEAVAKIASDAATDAVAKGLARMKVVNTTIQNEVERHVTEREVYRSADCRHDERGLQLINAALTGASAPQPVARGQLPAADPAARPEFRRDDQQAGRSGEPVPGMPQGSAR